MAAAATPTSLTFLGESPAASGDKHARREHGHPGHAGSGHGRAHQSSGDDTDPALPAAVPALAVPPVPPTADPSGPGHGHGHAYGHDKV